MGTVLGTLADLGYWWTYRVLDTQYFGPPQRRRRVFIVGHLGAPCPPEVLLEPESLPWNPPPSREAGEGAAPSVIKGAAIGRRPENGPQRGEVLEDGSVYILNTIERHAIAGQCHGTNVGEMGALRRGNGNVTGGVPFVAYRASEYRTRAFTEDDKAAALTEGTDPSRNGLVLPFDTTQVTSKGNYSRPKPGDPCHPLAKGAHPPALAFAQRTRGGTKKLEVGGEISNALATPGEGGRADDRTVFDGAVPRRLTPTECERLQGFPDGWTSEGIDEDGELVEMADTPRYRMLGNAVSMPVAEWIGRRILARDEVVA